jgi:isoleucyl-tRNA synthetase
MKLYPEVNPNPNFADISNHVLSFWQEHDIFRKSVENRPSLNKNGKNNEFVFLDGPPFANGLPHYGHLLTGFVKDLVARYQTLKGKRVERVFGWDCHGLPAEMQSEKELGISGRKAIEEYGVEKFNAHCEAIVLKYSDQWKEYVTKQARWVDFDNSYKTMDKNFMESVLWAFSELYKKGLVYESKRVMPYSWACETPLSNFETRMDNSYRERVDKAITVKFYLKKKPDNAPEGFKKYAVLAWTTTPWTLPSNLALAVGKDIKYACIPFDDECLILSVSSLSHYKKELSLDNDFDSYQILSGQNLKGIDYLPLFPYFAGHENSFKILVADFVEDGSGTGLVHMAPGFGEDDQRVCSEADIELVCPVDSAGKFTEQVPDYAGKNIFDANDQIIIDLKEKKHWFKTEQYRHNYPHCWRTDTPLIYKAVSSWYIKVTAIKDKLLFNNQKINWIPEHIKDGLFGKWLENARDWSVSRNRFWGTPIPVWRSDSAEYPRIDVYGSIAELEKDFGAKINDLHKHELDKLTRTNPDDPTGKSRMVRVSDVFDCWFESGSMPYAQLHYPFENQDKFDRHGSGDFIVEYVAQTRGWFYTLTVLSAALFDRPAFLNCICHGVILDEEGNKLSKRLQNYIDPKEIFEKYGSDALRFYMCSSAVMRGQELFIDKDGKSIVDTIRLVLRPIWNAYNFFSLYANADEIKAKLISKSDNFNDQYILSKLKKAVEDFAAYLDVYDVANACGVITEFFEVLNNWYIRRSRERFWRGQKDADKVAAYDTLYTVLYHMCVAASPVLPLTLEYIFMNLVSGKKWEANHSVHLQDYPNLSGIKVYDDLVKKIDLVRDVCTAVLNIRNKVNIRVRQPLQKIVVVGKDIDFLSEYISLIQNEVNVKEVIISADVTKYGEYDLKLNFKEVGKRLPHKIKDMIADLKANNWHKNKDGQIIISGELLLSTEYTMALKSFASEESAMLPNNDIIVLLDCNVSEALELEGMARDLVRLIQQLRKDANLNVSDQIECYIDVKEDVALKTAIIQHEDYIKSQTLSKKIVLSHNFDNAVKSINAMIGNKEIDIALYL